MPKNWFLQLEINVIHGLTEDCLLLKKTAWYPCSFFDKIVLALYFSRLLPTNTKYLHFRQFSLYHIHPAAGHRIALNSSAKLSLVISAFFLPFRFLNISHPCPAIRAEPAINSLKLPSMLLCFHYFLLFCIIE